MSRHRDFRNMKLDDYDDTYDPNDFSSPSFGPAVSNQYVFNRKEQKFTLDQFTSPQNKNNNNNNQSYNYEDEGYYDANGEFHYYEQEQGYYDANGEFHYYEDEEDGYYEDDYYQDDVGFSPKMKALSPKAQSVPGKPKNNKTKNKNNMKLTVNKMNNMKLNVNNNNNNNKINSNNTNKSNNNNNSNNVTPIKGGTSVLKKLQVRGKKWETKVKQLLEKDSTRVDKERLNMVVIGHVDAGKSTLMGHLLLKTGRIDKRAMHRIEKDSNDAGKSASVFAWLLDAHEEERSRGITVDVAVNHFETKHRHITLLDAPGHRDFIPNMISGAAQADCGILVVPATQGEFESAFSKSGQTREHAILAKSLGVHELIVAVNKLDAMEWNEQRYYDVCNNVKSFLKKQKYKEKQIKFVPVSGLTGENIIDQRNKQLLSWYKGKTLVDFIDEFNVPERFVEKPFRMCISDIFRSLSLGTTVAGKVETGVLLPDDQVLILPNNELVRVKAIEHRGEILKLAKAGDNVEIGLKDLSDESNITIGQYLSDPFKPIPLAEKFEAQILTLDIHPPITKGENAVLHIQSLNEPVKIKKLLHVVDKSTGEMSHRKPRSVGRHSSAVVQLRLTRPMCLELYSDIRQLGRFTLRRGNKTIAVGIVTKILK